MDLIQTNKLETLPLRLQSFAISRIGKKSIKDLHEAQVKQSCSEIINLCFVESGQIKQATPEMLAFNRDALFNELKSKFKDLTLDELKEAFKMGVRGEFGDYFGLCAATYHKWIKSYFERPERAEAMRVYLDLAKVEITPQLTDCEKRTRLIEGIKLAYKEYCESGELPFYPSPYYDFLKTNGYVNWSKEQIEEMKLVAETEYRGRLIKDRDNRVINTIQYKSILENLNTNQTFKNVCKKVGLKCFFESCKLSNYNINEIK